METEIQTKTNKLWCSSKQWLHIKPIECLCLQGALKSFFTFCSTDLNSWLWMSLIIGCYSNPSDSTQRSTISTERFHNSHTSMKHLVSHFPWCLHKTALDDDKVTCSWWLIQSSRTVVFESAGAHACPLCSRVQGQACKVLPLHNFHDSLLSADLFTPLSTY